MQNNKPLSCVIQDGMLVISIGISTLADGSITYYNNEYYDTKLVVTDEQAFAKEVVSQLCHEDDSGATSVDYLLDKMVENVIGDGGLGLEIKSVTQKDSVETGVDKGSLA